MAVVGIDGIIPIEFARETFERAVFGLADLRRRCSLVRSVNPDRTFDSDFTENAFCWFAMGMQCGALLQDAAAAIEADKLNTDHINEGK